MRQGWGRVGERRCRARAASAGSGDGGRGAARGVGRRAACGRARLQDEVRTGRGAFGEDAVRDERDRPPVETLPELDVTPAYERPPGPGGRGSQRGPRRTVLSRATVRV